MLDVGTSKAVDAQGVSRRDFLKFCSLMIGALALPRTYERTIEQALAAPTDDTSIPQIYFQWQNDFLRKTIYPMREVKLRDFLIYYMEVDVWSRLKGKDINTLTGEVYRYKKAWETKAVVALQEYNALRGYFLRTNARAYYSNFQPIDEAELNEINHLHAFFAQSWPKDIRNERNFVEGMITYWKTHRDLIRSWVKSRRRRHDGMDPNHPKYEKEGEELAVKEGITLPMAEQEMDQLRAFLATYDRIEERKLAWYRRSKSDPNFKTPEAEFLVKFPPEQQVTLRDLAYWKVEEYTKSIAKKNQYELLDMINQRFRMEPGRFPPWLQYMVVHFSGMRYASAHGSWADPKDLITRLRVQDVERELELLDNTEIERRCKEKVAVYEATGGTNKPKLALATEKEWKDKLHWHLAGVKASGPKNRRAGLIALQMDEVTYEISTWSTENALEELVKMKAAFPKWAWKEIVRFTPLRVREVSDLDWEKLTPQEREARNAYENKDLRAVMNAWENHDPSAWREEHARTQELIVTRSVCNETAEQAQHIRGQLPPGGLTPKPKWYAANEAEGKLPGAYYVKPTSEKDYTQGASILWLRFVNNKPSSWQIAKRIDTKQKVGLLPAQYITRPPQDGQWVYSLGEVTTRSRTSITPEGQKLVENQWLRWFHEATVAEVAETADGMMVITFETALPGGDQAVSAIGTFKMPLKWHLSDGSEDEYNRSFVGYVPEGQVPVEHLKTMLDWDKIFRK